MNSLVPTDDETIRQLRNLIQERVGLFFSDDYGLEVMSARLSPRLEKSGCAYFSEYYQLLSKGGLAATDEWLHVVVALSKTKSSFVRHAKAAQRLVDTVLPQWLLYGDKETLRIWSAGCSTGEEPLSVAMALAEAGWFDRLHIELYGSDANCAAIEKAQRGVYPESKTSYLSPDLRNKYFVPVDEGWQAKPELQQRIRWSVTNLMIESEVAELAKSDIIFCRNVFIYFSAPTICQTLRVFGRHMPSGGYLFTDDGDYFTALMSQVDCFERQKIAGCSIWMKRI